MSSNCGLHATRRVRRPERIEIFLDVFRKDNVLTIFWEVAVEAHRFRRDFLTPPARVRTYRPGRNPPSSSGTCRDGRFGHTGGRHVAVERAAWTSDNGIPRPPYRERPADHTAVWCGVHSPLLRSSHHSDLHPSHI